ncbi:MAG: hypothetical protein HY788_11315 [Deltaproteobacteria bacterium]|nr:hypothetical protein [Deltaproteobacteria bacterium]
MAMESTEARTSVTQTEEIKKKILEAASEIYARKRLGDASVEEIATAAGVSPTVTYRFVSSESAIMQMIMEDILSQFKEQMGPRLKTIKDPKEKLAAAMDLYFEIVAREANKCLLVYQESKSMVKSARRRIMSLELGIVEIFKEILSEGMKQGVFRQGDPDLISYNIMMLSHIWVLKGWHFHKRMDMHEFMNKQKEFLLRSISVDVR